METITYHTDPFYAECRAYGGIQLAIQKKKMTPGVAIKCYGFIFLSDADEQALYGEAVDFERDTVDLRYQKDDGGGYRVRAIVKQLGSPSHGVTTKRLGEIIRGIRALNRNKIYNRDIHLSNYLDGKIVDFGSSWTEPHLLLNALSSYHASVQKLADLVRFDEMVEEEEIPNPEHFRGMPGHRMKLRSG